MIEQFPTNRDPNHDAKNNQKFKISPKNQFFFKYFNKTS
jgi:hypothetical protein